MQFYQSSVRVGCWFKLTCALLPFVGGSRRTSRVDDSLGDSAEKLQAGFVDHLFELVWAESVLLSGVSSTRFVHDTQSKNSEFARGAGINNAKVYDTTKPSVYSLA